MDGKAKEEEMIEIILSTVLGKKMEYSGKVI